MAQTSVCALLLAGQDTVCEPIKRRYYQQAVLINKSDINAYTITRTNYEAPTPTCSYKVSFTLKPGKRGYLFRGPENGSNYFGSFDKTTSDLGFAQYNHNASLLIVGATQSAKCVLDSLDKGSFVVAYQFTDGTVEIYGMENGLSTGDYTYDIQGGGGGTAVALSSGDIRPENTLPLVYVSVIPGQESEDFDAEFAAAVVV